jgi:hypothetical protein
MWAGRRSLLLAAAVLAGAAAAVAGIGVFRAHSAVASGASPVAVSVDPAAEQGRIPPGFLGLSIEYWGVEAYAGKDPTAVNPVLVQLIRNLVPRQTAVLRIGGVTTDHTWWPVVGMRRPGGVTYNLNAARLGVMRSLAERVGARLIMGLNFEADSDTVAGAEARAMLAMIGRSRIAAFELGNEPELYPNPRFPWYTRDGHVVTGRPAGYDMAAFTREVANIATGMPRVPLADPSSGAVEWLSDLGRFLSGESRLGMATVHRYPFEACAVSPASAVYPTISRLLSPAASTGQAQGVAPYVALAHSHGLPIRVDEMNTVACGNPPGIPNTFAMALWAIDALFSDAQVGVDGVNIHTWPTAVYQLFTFRQLRSGWQGLVEPEYYGLLMFADAAPPGSRLLGTSSANGAVRVWATRAADRTIRVTLINDDRTAARRVVVRVPGAHTPADVERLLAPGPGATDGVTLGGQGFGSTTTGQLGPAHTTRIALMGGTYSVSLPAASAALLTLR